MLRLCFNRKSIISHYCRRRSRRGHIPKLCAPLLDGRRADERGRKKSDGNVNVYAAYAFLRFAEWTKFVSSHITFYGALIRLIVTFTSGEKSLPLEQLNML